MRFIYLLALMMVILGCGTAKKINTEIFIPEIDTTSYNDVSYVEGWNNLRAGKPGEAIKNFQMSRSNDEKLFVGFGYAFLAQNNFQMAKKNFEKALALKSDYLQAEFGLATLFELLADMDRAFQIYSKLRVIYPENMWVKVRYDYIKSSETQGFLENARKFKSQKHGVINKNWKIIIFRIYQKYV